MVENKIKPKILICQDRFEFNFQVPIYLYESGEYEKRDIGLTIATESYFKGIERNHFAIQVAVLCLLFNE